MQKSTCFFNKGFQSNDTAVTIMFKAQRVTKIKIYGPQTQLSSLIQLLHSLKLVHLLDHKKTDDLDIGKPLQESERISALLVKIHSLLSSIPLCTGKQEKVPSLADIEHNVGVIADEFSALHAQHASLQNMIAEKKEIAFQLQILHALELDVASLQHFQSLVSFIGTITTSEGLEHTVKQISKDYALNLAQVRGSHYIALFVPTASSQAVASIIQKYGFKQLNFADLSSYTGNVLEEAQKVQVALSLFEKDFHHIETESQKLQLQHEPFLRSAERFLHKEAEKAQAPLRFAETKYSFIIDGWVSTAEYQRLKSALEKEADNKVYVEVLEIKKIDKIPIIMKNMLLVKPFEFFLELYTLPSYKELDPSFLMFFTFPFFFGLMLGDVGYGIVTLLLFALLWWKMPKARALLMVMIYSSLISIAFGFAFGEYFGFESVSEHTGEILVNEWHLPLHLETISHGTEVETVYSFPRLMNRLHGEMEILGNTLPMVLVLGAIIGFIHVNLGLFLGFINELMSHGFKHAFFAKISWYVLELGAALLALSSLGMVPVHWAIGLGVIILAAVMLFIGEGVQGVVELPSLMTNILSYLRLGAVGLSSVGLAVVINENLAIPFMEKGGIFFVIAIFILIIGHTINIALGVIGPFLHSLRLHYVEFFSKFYKGGGIPFVAFGEEK
jgi:V/A-type H+-transporting ATPase subunit I